VDRVAVTIFFSLHEFDRMIDNTPVQIRNAIRKQSRYDLNGAELGAICKLDGAAAIECRPVELKDIISFNLCATLTASPKLLGGWQRNDEDGFIGRTLGEDAYQADDFL
jgi:hypothetical protein